MTSMYPHTAWMVNHSLAERARSCVIRHRKTSCRGAKQVFRQKLVFFEQNQINPFYKLYRVNKDASKMSISVLDDLHEAVFLNRKKGQPIWLKS